MAREPISKKLRFEVFKRDSFTCQYCGKRAPDVILNCDHVKPVVEGGTTDILNLVTACFDCNSGKGGRSLSDTAAMSKQVDQLAELQMRREQIDMMIEWRDQLSKMEVDVVDRIAERWSAAVGGQTQVNPNGLDGLRKLVGKFGVDIVLRSLNEATVSYLKRSEDFTFTTESMKTAFDAIGPICGVLKKSETRPYLKKLYYIRGILRNRLSYLNEWQAMKIMEEAIVIGGADVERIEDVAKEVRSWSQFRSIMEAWAAPDGEE
jgi:hypothetical protein